MPGALCRLQGTLLDSESDHEGPALNQGDELFGCPHRLELSQRGHHLDVCKAERLRVNQDGNSINSSGVEGGTPVGAPEDEVRLRQCSKVDAREGRQRLGRVEGAPKRERLHGRADTVGPELADLDYRSESRVEDT